MAFRFPWNTGNKDNEVFLSYDKHRNNLGDILSPIIARHLGSKEVRRISKRNEARRKALLEQQQQLHQQNEMEGKKE